MNQRVAKKKNYIFSKLLFSNNKYFIYIKPFTRDDL